MKERKSNPPNLPSKLFAHHALEHIRVWEIYFRLVCDLFYEHEKSLSHEKLADKFGLSKASVKRILNFLRETGVVCGRLPKLKLNLVLLSQKPLSYCTALVVAEPDI